MTTPAEIQFKQWLSEEARREGITPRGMWRRIQRTGYHGPPRRMVNRRVIFVENRASDISDAN